MKRLLSILITSLLVVGTMAASVSAASFDDLSSYQKQKFWQMWEKDCYQLLVDQKYGDYFTCSTGTMEKVSKLVEKVSAWCKDSDSGMDYYNKGKVTSDVYPNGIEDYFYKFSNGKSYLIEGACSTDNRYMYYQKSCSELDVQKGGKWGEGNGVCVKENSAPKFSSYIKDDKEFGDWKIELMGLGGPDSSKIGPDASLWVSAKDVDGDKLTFTAKNMPKGMTLKKWDNNNLPFGPFDPDAAFAEFRFTPTDATTGTYVIPYEVSDGKGGKDTDVLTVVVTKAAISRIDYIEMLVLSVVTFQEVKDTYDSSCKTWKDIPKKLFGENNQDDMMFCYAEKKGWISGYPDGTANPDGYINRAEAAKLAVEAWDLYNTSSSGFVAKDVPVSDWYYSYVSILVTKKIATLDNGYFYPSATMKQLDAKKWMANYKAMKK